MESASRQYQDVLQETVRNGDALGLQQLLEDRQGKVNVNSYDKEGQTALHQSCLSGDVELVKLLVKFGADVRLANKDGWNAFHIAAFCGHGHIIQYLINPYSR